MPSSYSLELCILLELLVVIEGFVATKILRSSATLLRLRSPRRSRIKGDSVAASEGHRARLPEWHAGAGRRHHFNRQGHVRPAGAQWLGKIFSDANHRHSSNADERKHSIRRYRRAGAA